MNNDEIRLSILCQCYKSKFGGKKPGMRIQIDLKDVDRITRNANLEYLLKKRLIDGQSTRIYDTWNVNISGITVKGIDTVETVLREALEELDPNTREEIAGEGTTLKMLDKFYDKCVNSVPTCEVAVKATNKILASL